MPNGSCSPPGPRSPTACSSPANGTSGRSSPGTRPTTTDGAPTAAGSSARPARPALTIPLADLSGERIKRRRVLGGLINEYERVALEDQVNAGGQVLEPHRVESLESRGEPRVLRRCRRGALHPGQHCRVLGIHQLG